MSTNKADMNHYANLASHYDEYYNYSKDYVDFFTNKIIEDLSVKKNEVVVELGSGTGIFAKAILDRVEPIVMICVDSSTPMLEMNTDNRITKLCQDAVEFSSRAIQYDKVYMKEFIHHISKKDRLALFRGIYRQLKNKGRLLILIEPRRLSYPLFGEALRKFETNQPSYLDVIANLERAGYMTSFSIVKHEINISKAKYIEMVRNRYMSVLSDFTGDELEDGIKEIHETYQSENLKFWEISHCIKAIKSTAYSL